MNGAEFLNLTAKERLQAESFFKVLVKKGYDVEQMANVMHFMGAMLVKYAKDGKDDRFAMRGQRLRDM
jgi:hypothetical protein